MTLETLFEKIRSMYVQVLAKAVRGAKKKEPHVEPLLRDAKGKVAREGVLASGVRLDLVVKTAAGHEEMRVDSTSQLGFQPVSVPWPGEAEVVVEPFVWDCAVVEVDVRRKKLLAPVRAWLDEWMDTEGEREADARGLFGVVHFGADPTEKGGTTTLSFDLGSAPATALVELFEVLVGAGATTMRIASSPSGAPRKPPPAKKKAAAKKNAKKRAARRRA